MKIFITGIAGTGKTTIARKLKDQGFKTIDIDHVPGLCSWVNNMSGEKVDVSNTDNVDNQFIDNHDYICDTRKLKELMKPANEPVFVFGSVGDNSDLLGLFDKVMLLQCEPETLVDRLRNRDTNDMGKDQAVQKRMLAWRVVFDDLMLKSGAIPLNTEKSAEEVVEEIILKIQD